MSCPFQRATTPRPISTLNSSGSGTSIPRPLAQLSTALPNGCSEYFSATAAISRISLQGIPSKATTSNTSGRPSVNVPVLSTTSASIFPASSKKMPPFTSTARRAMFEIPAVTAVGVAIANAQGQATNNSDTAVLMFLVTRKTIIASISTTGRNQTVKRSAMFWIGALVRCADSTRCTIRASVVSDPTLVARASIRPVRFSVPLNNSLPLNFSTGMDSPVIGAWSTLLAPATTTPSTGTRSPGLTITTVPTCTCPTGMLISPFPLRTVTASGARSSRLRILCRFLSRV